MSQRKKHWTQTREGRRRMREIMRARLATREAKPQPPVGVEAAVALNDSHKFLDELWDTLTASQKAHAIAHVLSDLIEAAGDAKA